MVENSAIFQLIIGVILFSAIMMTLVFIVLLARSLLLFSGKAQLTINQSKPVSAQMGQKLLKVLAEHEIFLAAACGGKGVCGQCLIKVTQGNAPFLALEAEHITAAQSKQGMRLACMQQIKNDLAIEIPKAVLSKKKRLCKVLSNQLVSTFVTQIDLTPVDEPALDFRAGDYILLEAPKGHIKFEDFDLVEEYVPEWERFGLLSLEVEIKHSETRAYSLANSPSETDYIRLLVRIATPPATAPSGTPAGKVSSYIFSLKPGDLVPITGPFGDFHIQESDREILFIGGGAGMAPLRSMIREQLLKVKTQRNITFWYGARSKQQLCYKSEFDQLMKEHQNFTWHIALSEPLATDNWKGHTGFIHAVVMKHYLSQHPSPQSIDYYLCGPPVMSAAVTTMLKGLGVKAENIFNDDFGSTK